MCHSKSGRRSALHALAIALVAAVLVGCGASPAPTSETSTSSVTGNWQFQVEVPLSSSPPTNLPIESLFGSLAFSGNKATGILNGQVSGLLELGSCLSANADLQFSGTMDASGNLTLTAPVAGGVATIAVNTLTPKFPGQNGTLQVVGGSCAESSTTILGFEVPSVTGTYTGTLTGELISPDGPSLPPTAVTASFVQSATPNADGEYALTGTITASGNCSGTFSFSQGLVYGAQFQNVPLTFPSPTPALLVFGNALTPGSSIVLEFEATPCGSLIYNGLLTRQ
jgi:hypothetical protein